MNLHEVSFIKIYIKNVRFKFHCEFLIIFLIIIYWCLLIYYMTYLTWRNKYFYIYDFTVINERGVFEFLTVGGNENKIINERDG